MSLKSETRKLIGRITPCHNPNQKPATEPPLLRDPLRSFGPAAQPIRPTIKMGTRNRIRKIEVLRILINVRLIAEVILDLELKVICLRERMS